MASTPLESDGRNGSQKQEQAERRCLEPVVEEKLEKTFPASDLLAVIDLAPSRDS